MSPADLSGVRGSSPGSRSCILCTVPRSGSWLLADLLEQTDLAGRPEEYFRPDHRAQWSKEWGIPAKEPYSRFISAAVALTSTDNGVFGLKMHWYQFEWFVGELRSLAESDAGATDSALMSRWLPRPHYVHLHRDDTVRQAISYYRATYSDRWFELVEDDLGTGVGRFVRPIRMPQQPDWGHVRFLEDAVIEHEQRWREFFERSEIVPLEIRYEDLVSDYEANVRLVLDFIGIPSSSVTELPQPRLKRQADLETERLRREYLVHRNSVAPRPLNLRPVRAGIVPRPVDASEESARQSAT